MSMAALALGKRQRSALIDPIIANNPIGVQVLESARRSR